MTPAKADEFVKNMLAQVRGPSQRGNRAVIEAILRLPTDDRMELVVGIVASLLRNMIEDQKMFESMMMHGATRQ